MRFYTAGGGERYTLNVCSSDGETPCSSTLQALLTDTYTLPVHTADDAKEYTPHVLNAAGVKGIHPVRICKLLRRPRIDSKEPISPARIFKRLWSPEIDSKE